MSASLESLKYKDGHLSILDQLLLPNEIKYVDICDAEDGWRAIHDMQVRGAPAIGVVGVLSLIVELNSRSLEFASVEELSNYVGNRLDYLVTARPTAVNMADARHKLVQQLCAWTSQSLITVDELKARLTAAGEKMLRDDVTANMAMGDYGADSIDRLYGGRQVTVLTHCNTGSLATAGYGTALGVIRSLFARGHLLHCFCTETRPYNQGARLTAYELVHDVIPSTLICDDMVAAAMQRHGIDVVVTGADRVAANGDTANKIGTYQIAVLARYHKIPFYIVAPSTSVDLQISSGEEIVIEERPHSEMTSVAGHRIAAHGINCWNPAFDVTPGELITGGIVTEYGVFRPNELKASLRH